ncbi:hypothetical protein [Domibacillus robiginosus]|uniref:hypothetical protein n=1 Tax=Domibacillus robiginosus TaxID=1071054 RepID=UPI000A53B334|nr:hypothetical protein [Domibacillus robiginosus]
MKWIGGIQAASLSLGQALSPTAHRSQLPARPIGVCAALLPPSGLPQEYIKLKTIYFSFEKRENVYPVLSSLIFNTTYRLFF